MYRRLIVISTVLVLLAAACGDDSTVVGGGNDPTTTTATSVAPVPPDDADAQTRLDAARARWEATAPDTYELTTRELCFCPETVWIDTVVDGEVVRHVAGGEDSFFDPGARTMEDLFARVQAAIDGGFATLELDFDAETGALERFWVDVDEMMADEENGVEAEVGPVTEAPAIDVAALTDDYGCGYGFTAGNPDQTVRFAVSWQVPREPDMSSPVTLPSAEWEGRLVVGTDLFANWCDDVIEPDEPEPVVAELWPVIDGEMTITPEDAPTDCSGTITASFRDVVIESPAGEPTPLGDFDIVNQSFGCFAG